MIKKSNAGRPRVAQKWGSMMRYNFFVSFALDRDVHTALHMAGAQAADLITLAVREYIVRHAHPAGLSDVQMSAAIDGLGIREGANFSEGKSGITPAPAPTAVSMPMSAPTSSPAPTPINALESNQKSAAMAFALSQLDDC